jgi:hypothetical protein
MPMGDREALLACANLIGSKLELVERVAARCSTYYTGTTSPEAVVYWLLQFGQSQAVEAAFRLLEQLDFIDSTRLTYLLGVAHQKIGVEATVAHYCVLGDAHDSGAIVGYEFLKSIGLDEAQSAHKIFRLDSPPMRPEGPLVLIDDNVTSGTQLIRLVQEMFEDFEGKREHFKSPLPSDALDVLRSHRLHLIVAVELGDGAEVAIAAAANRGLDLQVSSGSRSTERWLEYGNKLWASPTEAARAGAPFRQVGESLLSDKGWEPEKVVERALGYGNLQRLTVFAHNVPKSLITAFWKYGHYDNRPWVPLFPERSEWAKYRREIEPDAALSIIARQVVSGLFGNAAPSLRAGVLDDEDAVQTAVVRIPSVDIAKKIALDLADLAPKVPRMNVPRDTRANVISSFESPNSAEVRKYNDAVEEYHQSRDAWRSKVFGRLKRDIRLIELNLRVYNEGTAHAPEVVLTLELPPDVEFVEEVSPLPMPPTPPERPQEGWAGTLGLIQSQLDSSQFKLPAFDDALESPPYQLIRDRGTAKLRVSFDKIMQGSSRDRTVKFLRFPDTGAIQFRYRLDCEGQRMPVEGHIELAIETSPLEIPAFLSKAWMSELPVRPGDDA